MASSFDPMGELRERLVSFGALPPRDGPTKVYRLMSVHVTVCLIFAFLSTFGYIISNHPFVEKVEAFQCFFSGIHLITKTINLNVRKERVWALMNDFKEIWKQLAQDPDYKVFLLKESKFLKKAQLIVIAVSLWPIPSSILLSILRNIGHPPEEREVVFKIWGPFPKEWFYTHCIYEVFLMSNSLYLFSLVYLSILVPCLITSVFMKALIRMLEANPDKLDVRACILLHQKILRLIADINTLYAEQMFFDMLLSAIYISFRSFELIKAVRSNDPRAIGVFLFLCCCFGGPFIVCLSGHVIEIMSEKVYRCSSFGGWYGLSASQQKDLNFLMIRASNVPVLGYRNFMFFNMDQYGNVVRATYSYITILTNM